MAHSGGAPEMFRLAAAARAPVAWDARGALLLTAGDDGMLVVSDRRGRVVLELANKLGTPLASVAWDAAGEVAALTFRGCTQLALLSAPAKALSFLAADAAVACAAWHPTRPLLAIGTAAGTVKLFSRDSQSIAWTSPALGGGAPCASVLHVAWSRDGELVVAAADGTVSVLAADGGGQPLAQLSGTSLGRRSGSLGGGGLCVLTTSTTQAAAAAGEGGGGGEGAGSGSCSSDSSSTLIAVWSSTPPAVELLRLDHRSQRGGGAGVGAAASSCCCEEWPRSTPPPPPPPALISAAVAAVGGGAAAAPWLGAASRAAPCFPAPRARCSWPAPAAAYCWQRRRPTAPTH